jgi:molecular chaperone GrpE (heat shock protein)
MTSSSEDKEETGAGSERPAGAEGTEHERLKAELGRAHGLYLRTLADFDNYRRRVELERASSAHASIV